MYGGIGYKMKNMKYILGLMIAMPFCAWAADANASDVGATKVPFGRIYDAVKSFTDLYETNFVKLLDNKPTYTLGDVAQACVNFIKYSNGRVTVETCQKFMREIIGTDSEKQSSNMENAVAKIDDNAFYAIVEGPTTIKFTINAQGEFEVDCGVVGAQDGKGTITHETVMQSDGACHYENAGKYTMKISGRATGYDDGESDPVISFEKNSGLVGIGGSLGAVFPTLDEGKEKGQQPRFLNTFYGCENLGGNIPENLFKGIKGTPVTRMFAATFSGCSQLKGPVPKGLFGELEKTDDKGVFEGMFDSCNALTGAGEVISNMLAAAADDDSEDIEDASDTADKIFVTTTKGAPSMTIYINAAGEFSVDCGDGKGVESYRFNNPFGNQVQCSYPMGKGYEDKQYTITIAGNATGYGIYEKKPTISFVLPDQVESITGDLYDVFPTIQIEGYDYSPFLDNIKDLYTE